MPCVILQPFTLGSESAEPDHDVSRFNLYTDERLHEWCHYSEIQIDQW